MLRARPFRFDDGVGEVEVGMLPFVEHGFGIGSQRGIESWQLTAVFLPFAEQI